MPDPEAPPSLDATLAARTQALAGKARRSGGRLDAEDRADVQALAQLQQLLVLQRPRPVLPRWPIALTLLAALALASALMSLRVTRTPVELDAEATAVRVELSQAQPQPQPITGTLALAGLRAVGVQGGDAGDASQPVVLAALPSADATCRSSLTLEPLLLPAGARITLRASPLAARLRLAVGAPGATLRLSQVRCPGGGQPSQTRNLVLTLGAEEADLELEAAAKPLALAPVMEVQGLALDEVETLAGDNATHVRLISTLRGGHLHRLALDDRVLVLRRGELILLGGASGELREVEARAGVIHLRFVGELRTLSRGEGAHARNLMPTLLEWLRANQALALVWGSSLTLFGLATAAWRWWRRGSS
jgi:hypothetical protein